MEWLYFNTVWNSGVRFRKKKCVRVSLHLSTVKLWQIGDTHTETQKGGFGKGTSWKFKWAGLTLRILLPSTWEHYNQTTLVIYTKIRKIVISQH